MKLRQYIFPVLLIGIILAPRLPKLDSFVTIDEPFWLSVGANYYYALGQREFQNTVYEYHPAVTTMTLITTAFLVDFPEYRGLGQGYFDVDKEKFDPFIIAHGHDPMHLLYLSRLFQVLTIALFALLIFYLLSILIGEEKAFLITALTSSAPFFLGHSRVLSHEALVATFVITSILGLMAYLENGRKWYYLLISAASAALAQLTKSSAMAMFPVIALILFVSAFERIKQQGFRTVLIDHLKVLSLWTLMLIAVYFLLWPGMWVAPGKMLYNVYGNAFSYALEGSRLEVTHQLTPSKFNLASASGTMYGFTLSLIWRATPIGWLGIIFAIPFLFARGEDKFFSLLRKMILYLVVNAAMFMLLFSLAQGRNSAHYIMTSHVSMDVVSSLGWTAFLGWLGTKWKLFLNSRIRGTVIAALIIFQLMSSFSFYPYYYTYSNPIMIMLTGTKPVSDYGEGFEQAAAYLAQKPNSNSLTVFSFRGRGPFSYFFPGRTILINPLFMEEPGMGSVIERMAQSDYLVINDAFGPRTVRTALFVQALAGVTPEHIIQIKGVQTIRIYRIADLPPSFYETISK